METITHETAQQLLKEANAKLMAECPKFAKAGCIEIHDTGFEGFNPTISWFGTSGNRPETAAEFAKALMLAAKLVEEMPHKGAKVTF